MVTKHHIGRTRHGYNQSVTDDASDAQGLALMTRPPLQQLDAPVTHDDMRQPRQLDVFNFATRVTVLADGC